MNKKEKCSITQKNRIVIHKGDLEKRVYYYELDSYLNSGWQKGISEKHRKSTSSAHIGQVAWNKGKTGYMSEEGRKHISELNKSRPVWNKNLTITDERVKRITEKSKNTKIKKYGNGFGNNNMNDAHKAAISKSTKGKPKHHTPESLRIKLTKDYLTKKKNNSFNKSDAEEKLYQQLLKENVNKTIYRQYKDEKRYPFYCDFYIVEDDLFIELNAHWTHGGRPYDPNDEKCKKQLLEWQEKAKTSKFYQQAIETWTIRDVKKQKAAKENNLNYKVIY